MSTIIGRRHCLQLLGASALGVGIDAALGGTRAGLALAQGAAPTVVRTGLQRGALGALKVSLPLYEGKYGLKYDQKIFNDATSVILAMEQKELEMGNVTAQHVIRAMDEGINLVVVAGWGGGEVALVQAKDVNLPVNDFAAFKALVAQRKGSARLKIGAPTGSQQHLKLIALLRGLSLDPDRDVDIVNVPFPEHPRAIDGKQVDMVITIAAFAALIIVNGSGKLFHHVYGENEGRWEIGFAVRRDMVQNTPDLVQRIVGSHVEAMKTFITDVPKQIELEEKESSFPKPVVEMTQRDFLKLSYRITLEDLKRTATLMHDIGWAKKDHSAAVESYVDYSFLEKATGEPKQKLMDF